METLLDRLGVLRIVLSPIEGLLGTALLREVDPDGPDHPMGWVLHFEVRLRETDVSGTETSADDKALWKSAPRGLALA